MYMYVYTCTYRFLTSIEWTKNKVVCFINLMGPRFISTQLLHAPANVAVHKIVITHDVHKQHATNFSLHVYM